MVTDTNKDAMVARLRKEHADEFEAGRQLGIKIGLEWADEFGSPTDIRLIATGEQDFAAWNYDAFDFLSTRYDAVYPDSWVNEELDKLGVTHRTDEKSEAEKGFAAGFVEAVNEGWLTIKQAL